MTFDICTVEAELLALFQKERGEFAKRCRLRELELDRKAAHVKQQDLMLSDFAALQASFKVHLMDLHRALTRVVTIVESDEKMRSADPGIEELEQLRAENKRLETEITQIRKRHTQTLTDFKSFASILNDSH